MQEYEHRALEIQGSATGIYIAYPTSPVLKPTYHGHKTLVNNEHTKIGITISSFVTRENEYMRTFSGELAFIPLVAAPLHVLAELEARLLMELRRRYSPSGSAREWFHTTERQAIAQLVWSVTGAA